MSQCAPLPSTSDLCTWNAADGSVSRDKLSDSVSLVLDNRLPETVGERPGREVYTRNQSGGMAGVKSSTADTRALGKRFGESACWARTDASTRHRLRPTHAAPTSAAL